MDTAGDSGDHDAAISKVTAGEQPSEHAHVVHLLRVLNQRLWRL